MAVVKKSFRITKSYKDVDNKEAVGSISFGPRSFGEQGQDILAAKVAAGMVVPGAIPQSAIPEISTVDEGVWFDCDESKPLSLEDGIKFDKKFEVYLMNFQLSHRGEIVRFLIKDLVITWSDDSQILAEDIVFDTELGRLGDATLHVLHGWRTRNDHFTNKSFNIDSAQLTFVPKTHDETAVMSPNPDTGTPTTFEEAGMAAAVYAAGQWGENPLNKKSEDRLADFVYTAVEPHPEEFVSPLSEAVRIVLEQISKTGGPTLEILTASEQQRLATSAFEPDPFVDPDPFVVTVDLHGFFYKTKYTFDNPPLFPNAEAEARAMKRMREDALNQVLDHYGKPYVWFNNPKNSFFAKAFGLQFADLTPSHSGEHTEKTNWCLGYGNMVDPALAIPGSYQDYEVIERENVKPLIEFIEFRTPSIRPGDVYRAYFEIYKPKLDTIKIGLWPPGSEELSFKSASLTAQEATDEFRTTAAACTVDSEEMENRIAEHRAYAAKRKQEIARKMREHASRRQYRQQRQDEATSYGAVPRGNLNLGPLGNYSFGEDSPLSRESDRGFSSGELNYSAAGVKYNPKSRTLTIPQNRLKSIIKKAAGILRKAGKDMEGLVTIPNVNLAQEASLLEQVIPAFDGVLKADSDYQSLIDTSGFSYDPLGVKEPPDDTPQHGIESELARVDFAIQFEPVKITNETTEEETEIGLSIKTIWARTSGQSTMIMPSKPQVAKKFKISPLNRPRTMNYLARVGEIAQGGSSGGSGIPLLGGKSCGILSPSGWEIAEEFTSPKLQLAGSDQEDDVGGNAIIDAYAAAKGGVENWWKTSAANLESNNFGMKPDYNLSELMPSFGDLCTFEDLWDKFISKFSLLDLICDYVKCLKLPNVNISLDFDFRLPPIPKLPTIDFMNFLRLLLTEMLIEMLKRMLCSIVTAILDTLKLDPCPGELEEELFGSLDFNDLARRAAEEGAEGLDDLSGKARIGVRALAEAMTDTGIPRDRMEDVKKIIDDIFKILTPREICLLLRGESSKRVLTAIKNLVAALHDPFFAKHFSVEENVLYFFESIGVFIDPALCEELEKVDKVLGQVTCTDMNDAVSKLREHLQNKGTLAEDEIQKLLDIAKDNLEKRAAALSNMMSGDSLAEVVPELFNPGGKNAIISSLPDSFKNSLDTAAKAIFDTAKMAYTTDLSKFVPALYNQKQYLPQPGDPDYSPSSRMKLERATELLRIFEQQLGGQALDVSIRRTVPEHNPQGLVAVAGGLFAAVPKVYDNPYFATGDGTINPSGGRGDSIGQKSLLDAMNSDGIDIVNLFSMRESLYVDFVVEYYDPTDKKVYTEDSKRSPRIPFYKRKELSKPVNPSNPGGPKIPVISLVRKEEYKRNTAENWLLSFSGPNLKAAAKRSLYGDSLKPGHVYNYGRQRKSKIDNYLDLAYYCYNFYKKEEPDDVEVHVYGHSEDHEPTWAGDHPLTKGTEGTHDDHAHIESLRVALIEDIGSRLGILAGVIGESLQEGAMRVTSNSELLPEIKPYFSKMSETLKNKKTQDIEERFRGDLHEETSRNTFANVEAVDASLDMHGRPVVSLIFEPSVHITTFDGRERFKNFYLENPPSIDFIENPWTSTPDTYSYTAKINDPYLIKKSLEFTECITIPPEFRGFVPSGHSSFLRRDSYAKLFFNEFETVLNRYGIPINADMRENIFNDNSVLKNGIVKDSIYRSTLEAMFEFIMFKLSDSRLFNDLYVTRLEKRITGRKYYEPEKDCIINPTGLTEGGILKFSDLISDMITEVEREYAKPENHPQNMDFSAPGPVEKAFQNVIVRAIIKIFHIEFMLRGALTNSTYSPSYYQNNKLLDKYFDEFVQAQLASKKAFAGAPDSESTMDEFYKVMIRVSGISQDSYSESGRKMALRSLLQKEKERIPGLSNKVYLTNTTKDYIDEFISGIPILEVKPYIEYGEFTGHSDPLNLKLFQRGNADMEIFFMQDIPPDLVINGGFFLEHYIRLNQKPDAKGSLTDFRIETGEILREKIFENLKAWAEDTSFITPPESEEDLDDIIDTTEDMESDFTLHANEDDEFKNTEVVSGREIQVLLSDYVTNKLFPADRESPLETELKEAFYSTLNIIVYDDPTCQSDSIDYYGGEVGAETRRNNLADYPRVVRRLPTRLIRRNRTHFRVADFLWGVRDEHEEFRANNPENDRYVKDLFKGSLWYDSRGGEETRYYAVPLDACYHYERMHFWAGHHNDPFALFAAQNYPWSETAHPPSSEFTEKMYNYHNLGGGDWNIHEFEGFPIAPYLDLEETLGETLIENGARPYEIHPPSHLQVQSEGSLEAGKEYFFYARSGAARDDSAIEGVEVGLRRCISHKAEIQGSGIMPDEDLREPYHPFDENAPWFNEAAERQDAIEGAYSNRFGHLDKEEFQNIIDLYRDSTECTNTETQEVEFEDWDEIIIDLFAESSVPYHIPGESFHLADEMPSLQWHQVEYLDFLIPYWNQAGRSTDGVPNRTRVNWLSGVPQTIGEMIFNPETPINAGTNAQFPNEYGVHASPFRFSGNDGSLANNANWAGAPNRILVNGGVGSDGLHFLVDGSPDTHYMRPPRNAKRHSAWYQDEHGSEYGANHWQESRSWKHDPSIENTFGGGHHGRRVFRPTYWSEIKVAYPMGFNPIEHQGNVVDKWERWRRLSPGEPQFNPDCPDPQYLVGFNKKKYSTNTYYIPIRLLITQVVRRGGENKNENGDLGQYSNNAQVRGETYARVLIPELLKPHDSPQSITNFSDIDVSRADLLQEALDGIYREYQDLLIQVRNNSRERPNDPNLRGKGPGTKTMGPSGANYTDIESTDPEKWNQNADTRAYIVNLPNFAKTAYHNDFTSFGEFTKDQEVARADAMPAYFSIPKLYSRACELEVAKELGTFTLNNSKIDEQFMNNPGFLLKDWGEKHISRSTTRTTDFKTKANRIMLDGTNPKHNKMSIEGRQYHNTAFGFKFPFFSYIETDDIETYDRELTTTNRTMRSRRPKNIREFIDDEQIGFSVHTVATIDSIARKWYGAKRYESFWGQTSSKSWLRGQIGRHGTLKEAYRKHGDFGDQWATRDATNNVRNNIWDKLHATTSRTFDEEDHQTIGSARAIHKIWQSALEWPNGPKCGLSPFVADGRWTITDLLHLTRPANPEAFPETMIESLRPIGLLNAHIIDDSDGALNWNNSALHATLAVIYNPEGTTRKKWNEFFNERQGYYVEREVSVGGDAGRAGATRTERVLDSTEVGYFTRSLMDDTGIAGSIVGMINEFILERDANNPLISDMIRYLKVTANKYEKESQWKFHPDSGSMRSPVFVGSVMKYLQYIVGADLKRMGLDFAEGAGPTARGERVDIEYEEKMAVEFSSTIGYNANPMYIQDWAQWPQICYTGWPGAVGSSHEEDSSFLLQHLNAVKTQLLKRKFKLLAYPIELYARQLQAVEAVNNIFWSFLESGEMLPYVEETKREVIEEVLQRLEDLFLGTEIKFGVRLVQVVRNTLTNKIMKAYRDTDPKLVNIVPKEERSYFLHPMTDEDKPGHPNYSMMTSDPHEFIFCNPLLSYEEEFPVSCVNYHNIYRRYKNEKGRKYLRDKLFEKPEFKALTGFIFPLNKFATITNIFGTQILSSRKNTQELLDTTKVTLMEIFKTMTNRNDFGRKNPFDHLGAAALNNSELFDQFNKHATSEGPDMKCIEFPDMGQFLEALVDQIKNIIYYTPSIILRGIASAIDPMYIDMKQRHGSCEPGDEHIKNLTWGATTMYSEKRYKTLIEGTTGCDGGNKYAPVFPGFPIDMGTSIANLLSFNPKPLGRTLDKFATYLYDADLPFFKFDFEFDIPCLMEEPYEKTFEAPTLGGSGRYGHPLSPITILALSTPELPTEKNTKCGPVCGAPPPISTKQERDATQGCPDLEEDPRDILPIES